MEPSARSSLSSNLAIPLSIVIAGALIGGGLYFGVSKNATGQQAAAAIAAQKVNIKDVKITADTPYIGKANAPVTLAVWTDYQCPFCKAIEVGGVPQITTEPSFPMLIKDYVGPGNLRIVFKDSTFLGQDSTTAALYGHAVWATYPDKYFAWRTAMYKAQDEEGDQGFGDEPSVLALIKKIPGMDANKLNALVAKNKDAYAAMIASDQQEGAAFGINGTPGAITGTQSIDGAQPPSAFKAAIDAQLK